MREPLLGADTLRPAPTLSLSGPGLCSWFGCTPLEEGAGAAEGPLLDPFVAGLLPLLPLLPLLDNCERKFLVKSAALVAAPALSAANF